MLPFPMYMYHVMLVCAWMGDELPPNKGVENVLPYPMLMDLIQSN